jgi:hypothetical protein
MTAAEHRYGDCYIGVQVRLVGDQPIRVRGITAVASAPGREHIAVTVGRILIYLEDHAALDALAAAVEQATNLAEDVFGPVDDEITLALSRQRLAVARTEQNPRA